jgi:hypothetical protein
LVGGAVVRIARLGAFAEERIGLVEEEYPFLMFSVIEQAGQILLRLSNVLGDDF